MIATLVSEPPAYSIPNHHECMYVSVMKEEVRPEPKIIINLAINTIKNVKDQTTSPRG